MDEVFVYWDDSNLIPEARRRAEELPDGPDARCRVRVDYDRLLLVAQADRPLVRVAAAGPRPRSGAGSGIGWRTPAWKSGGKSRGKSRGPTGARRFDPEEKSRPCSSRCGCWRTPSTAAPTPGSRCC